MWHSLILCVHFFFQNRIIYSKTTVSKCKWFNWVLLLLYINGSQRAKNEKVDSLHTPTIKIYMVESVGLKGPITLLKLCFLYVKFGAISWKNWYFVNNCLMKVSHLKNAFCTYVTHIFLVNHLTPQFVSAKSVLNWIQIFLPKTFFLP